jgi:hypothetical protein
MCGAVPSLPNTPSRRGAQLKESTEATLPLPFVFLYLWMRYSVLVENYCVLCCLPNGAINVQL